MACVLFHMPTSLAAVCNHLGDSCGCDGGGKGVRRIGENRAAVARSCGLLWEGENSSQGMGLTMEWVLPCFLLVSYQLRGHGMRRPMTGAGAAMTHVADVGMVHTTNFNTGGGAQR